MSDPKILELYKYAAYLIALVLTAIRVGGLHFIFLFFIKLLRLDFTERKLKKVSDNFYDIKLFKFFTGIKARNVNDVVFIQECINSGKIHSINFIFSGFFGYAGSKRSNKIDLIFVLFLSASSLVLGFMTADQANQYKKNYATYVFDDGAKYYLNAKRILDSKKGREIDCQILSSFTGKQRERAEKVCPYLTKNEPRMKDAVLNGIKSNNRERVTFISLSLVFLTAFLILFVGFGNFNFSSAQLRKLKLEKLRQLRQER
ncbi:hypothetical protein CKF42_16190 [Pantoea sp. ARC270]|uniref:hypothetical protein n=1 Tax=Pantoea sp. ARC270 TaxID=2027923 RepID=UPI000DAA242B|nr:hypothetical protein [Pantoea sp. ARC270]PZL85581.1 hypothetical protein CKF42_16190 [Pantoea sp. ARC270]